MRTFEQLFVPYEHSFILKELGFDEPCLDFYDNNEELFYNHENKEKIHIGDSVKAPLYAQAFEWFRENHSLEGQIKSWTERGEIVYYVSTEKVGAPSRFKCYEINVKTYAEAELACLIKLIELVKK